MTFLRLPVAGQKDALCDASPFRRLCKSHESLQPGVARKSDDVPTQTRNIRCCECALSQDLSREETAIHQRSDHFAISFTCTRHSELKLSRDIFVRVPINVSSRREMDERTFAVLVLLQGRRW